MITYVCSWVCVCVCVVCGKEGLCKLRGCGMWYICGCGMSEGCVGCVCVCRGIGGGVWWGREFVFEVWMWYVESVRGYYIMCMNTCLCVCVCSVIKRHWGVVWEDADVYVTELFLTDSSMYAKHPQFGEVGEMEIWGKEEGKANRALRLPVSPM